MPKVLKPDARHATPHPLAAPETIIVGDVDITDPTRVGPPTLQMWIRFDGAPSDGTIARALLSYATDGWLIATALRPHEGYGQAMAHTDISTGVVSHTLTFHDEFEASSWLLIDHRSEFAGNGRAFGRANVFAESGAFVASFVQEALVRAFPEGQSPMGREATIF
jgi:acyl-CoA thioesterase II